MPNITPINAKPPALKTTEQLSKGLKRLLEQEPSAETAIDLIASDPRMLAEAKAALPALWKRLDAGGDEAVQAVISKRLPVYPQGNRTREEWQAWWSAYYDTLSDQPAECLEAGMQEWVRTDQTGFMPKPGQLLALVKAAAEPYYRAVSRANRIAKIEPKPTPTPETLEERQRMAAEVRQLFAIKPKDETQ